MRSADERIDAEQFLAEYLDQKVDGSGLTDGKVVFRSTEELLDSCVHKDHSSRCWGKRTSVIRELALKGLEHVLHAHCKAIRLDDGKVVARIG